MKEHERKLLNSIQSHFPLESRPFLIIGKELDMTEEEVILTLIKLKQQGYIRRLGGVFDSNSLGYVSVLCAAIVPEEKIDLAAQNINSFSSVTHNYIRNHRYNMWFTLTALRQSDIDDTIDQIKRQTGIPHILKMKAINKFKIQVHFKLKGDRQDE